MVASAPPVLLPTLDHVALRVRDRDAFEALLVERLDVRAIERTDAFTLLGADAAFGKVTLLDAIDEREPLATRIVSLVLAESEGADVPPPITLPGGLVVTFTGVDELGPAWAGTPRHALVGASLRAHDPALAAAELEARHGMRVASVGPEHAVLEVGDHGAGGRITFTREPWRRDEASMLDHVGIRIPDAVAAREHAERDGVDVVRWVDAPHSRAVFVSGPEDLLVEYVELTAPLGA